MHKYLYSFKILLLLAISVNSQEIKEKKNFLSTDTSFSFWVEAGINASSFQKVNSEFGPGYLAGATILRELTNRIGLSYSVQLSQQNIYYKNHPSEWKGFDYVYRQFYDVDISILFLELPIMITYNFWNTSIYSFYGSLGAGYGFSVKNDYRKYNFRNTNEILGPAIGASTSQSDKFIDDPDNSVTENSGFNINAGIQFNYKKFFLRFLYINKRNKLRFIDRQHTFMLSLAYRLGYQLKRKD